MDWIIIAHGKTDKHVLMMSMSMGMIVTIVLIVMLTSTMCLLMFWMIIVVNYGSE